MLSVLRGAERVGVLLVWLLWTVGCSAGPATTVPPPPNPTTVIIPTQTPPPPTASVTALPATEAATATKAAATLAATQTAPPASTATPDPALEAIYSYLDARARADVADVTALACQSFQGQAATEAVSFRSMQAKLEGVVCAINGISGPYTLVGCGGKIITTYGTETREWDLSNSVYQAVAEDGAWKMCGYN